MREYVRGDDLRRIVWRATARTGRVMVREAEQGITDHITVILDTDRASHSHDAEDLSESFEMAAIPGMTPVKSPSQRPRIDFGPDFEKGIVSKALPTELKDVYHVLVPKIDAGSLLP